MKHKNASGWYIKDASSRIWEEYEGGLISYQANRGVRVMADARGLSVKKLQSFKDDLASECSYGIFESCFRRVATRYNLVVSAA